MLPIRVGLDPMERLLVATFKGDPEFEAIEPQVFDDADRTAPWVSIQ
jgi:hypothetical protein